MAVTYNWTIPTCEQQAFVDMLTASTEETPEEE